MVFLTVNTEKIRFLVLHILGFRLELCLVESEYILGFVNAIIVGADSL